jgi:hypothetical protein
MEKSWMQSKTIWLNIAALTLGAMPEMMSLIDVNVLLGAKYLPVGGTNFTSASDLI